MTWSNEPQVVNLIKKMMIGSWEACVNYMTPMGLHNIMAAGHHYGPQPDYVNRGREDWSSTYYHKADANGNNIVNLLDVTYLIDYLYRNGPDPICGTTGE